ncbi:MAG: hybrid sensor histidine kinase/response regulator, partial [Tepidisphaeraceae bacterium]
ILELLADPLTHLIRNCCDHGIEPPEKRTSTGKSPSGRIALAARQERGQIVIEIRDDGRGIDPAAVKRKAIEQGIKRGDELERLNQRQIYDLILLSGFSTAAQVTDVSGRGVGMDVVKTNLDQIGGVIEIDSAPGRGTVFTLRLPLTLAIMPCLLLGTNGCSYAVPTRDVEEILRLNGQGRQLGIEKSHDGEVLRWRDTLLSVVRLRDMLEQSPARQPPPDRSRQPGADTGFAAVIRLGSRRFVLAFDEVLESENLVVKPLHPLLRPLGVYAAATILGDGTVALILNSEGVARHTGILGRPAAESELSRRDSIPAVETEPVMLFRSGSAELLGTRMDAVRRVVKMDRARIEQFGDRELVDIDGTATNVLRLDQFLSLSPCPDTGLLFLVLPRTVGAPVGILVSEIVDTPSIALHLDDRAYKADGVLGTAMVRGEIAVFIDFDRVIQMWSQVHEPTQPAIPGNSGKRILVVDDTRFFQKLVSEHLRSQGHEVMVAANGREALEVLKSGNFDLVVCDVEMPVMDGLSFARRVREEPRYAGLPLVALTTLNTPESRAAAAASGFDAYEVKLDRGSLLLTVQRLLSGQINPSASGGHS